MRKQFGFVKGLICAVSIDESPGVEKEHEGSDDLEPGRHAAIEVGRRSSGVCNRISLRCWCWRWSGGVVLSHSVRRRRSGAVAMLEIESGWSFVDLSLGMVQRGLLRCRLDRMAIADTRAGCEARREVDDSDE